MQNLKPELGKHAPEIHTTLQKDNIVRRLINEEPDARRLRGGGSHQHESAAAEKNDYVRLN